MFDLEIEIQKWKKALSCELMIEDIDELESHLRDNIDFLLLKNMPLSEAFEKTLKDIGEVSEIKAQFVIFYEEVFMDFEKKIYDNIGDPVFLEDLYHQNPYAFKKCIERIPSDECIIKVWKVRLNYKIISEKKTENFKLAALAAVLSVIAGISAWIPKLFNTKLIINSNVTGTDSFYSRNFYFFILPFIMLFFFIKFKIPVIKSIIISLCVLFSMAFINLLPSLNPDHTKLLSVLHMPLLLWIAAGIIYANEDWKDMASRVDFLKFSGEFFIYTVLLYLGFGVLSLFTISIFNSINLDINDFYSKNISILGFFSIPIIGSYLAVSKRELVQNITPILAKIFSPLFLISMTFFIIALFITGKNPYNDREFLLIFNFMLLMVLALVFFVITERNIDDKKNLFDIINILLIITALIINVIALSAIVFRLSVWGFSANKTTVLGENLILMINLGGLLFYYLKFMFGKTNFMKVEYFVSKYLVIYFIWIIFVIFIFPFVFQFR